MEADTWIDLSRGIDESIPYPAAFPALRMVPLGSAAGGPRVTQLTLCTHMGTHLDAASHFIDSAPTITDYPLSRFILTGVVWRVTHTNLEISVRNLELAQPKHEPGDAVFLETGWARLWSSLTYLEHPYLSEQAVQWLLEAGISMLGLDMMSPDVPVSRRPTGFTFPTHRALLSAGVLIAENLCSLDQLRGRRVQIMALPIPLLGADGAPARVIARRVD